jgi:transitional endoplasmic reticulum ATPase
MKDDEDEMMEGEDPVPVLTRTHFEEAIAAARCSVNNYDLEKFERFREKSDPNYKAKKGKAGIPKINWPVDNSNQFRNKNEDEDDIYS